MAKKASSSSKKKKGPKGKKARAKAKLERQWGEQPTGEPAVKRQGKSRLLSSMSSKTTRDPEKEEKEETTGNEESSPVHRRNNNVHNHDDALLSSDDDDDEDDMVSNGKAYASLLNSIRQETKGTAMRKYDNKADDLYFDDNDEDDKSSTNESDASAIDDDDDDDLSETLVLSADPFTERFSSVSTNDTDMTPATSQQQQQQKQQQQQQQTVNLVKVDAARYCLNVDEHYEVQASQHLLECLDTSCTQPASKDNNNNNNNKSPMKWSALAHAYFCNTRDALQKQWQTQHHSDPRRRHSTARTPVLDANQCLMLPPLACYADVLHTNMKDASSRSTMQQILALHILHHVLTSRNRVSRNNKRLQEQQTQHNNINNNDSSNISNPNLVRDQGFTRPTVLILLPTRGVCHAFVSTLLDLLSGTVDKQDRFETEYGPPKVEENMDQVSRQRRRTVLEQKGKEWTELFGDKANDDDDFRIGLSLNPKRVSGSKQTNNAASANTKIAIKLFTDFYKSDIILASPLAMKVTAEEDDMQVDFLSSIEICLVWRTDVLMMQNWDHVTDVLALLNQQPQDTNDTDFSRVRPYLLDGRAEEYRQLIVMGAFADPLIISAFKRYAKSRAGQFRIKRRCPAEEAAVTQVLLPTRQVFQRVNAASFATQSQDRLNYFVDMILPQLDKHQQKHTLIYVPSYFDFIALRNLLLKREMDFVSVTEYSRTSEVSRGRARFLQGRKSIMLYTGRAHYFHRHLIKGARHVIFFGLPEHAEFYAQHVNVLNEGLLPSSSTGIVDSVEDMNDKLTSQTESSLVLFTRYESHALERIVGTSNCSRMTKGEKSTFLFSA